VGDYISLGSNVTTAQITAIANNTRLTIQTNLDTQLEGDKIYNESEISAGMDVGKAYVKGFEYESIATQYLDVDKGRDTETVTDYSISTELGNYLVVDTVSGLIDIGASEVVHLHSVPYASINLTNNTVYQATQVVLQEFEVWIGMQVLETQHTQIQITLITEYIFGMLILQIIIQERLVEQVRMPESFN